MQIPSEYDPIEHKMRCDEREASEAASEIQKAFEYHMLRTGAFSLAMRDTRIMARDKLGFASEANEMECTFFKPDSNFRVLMTQGSRDCFSFEVIPAY